MAEITASLVKELRERTGAGMMDCKKALGEVQGDLEQAVDWLRKKGLAAAAKKAGRVTAEGLVGVNAQGTIGSIIEINAETDFVARNDKFQGFVSHAVKLASSFKGDLAEFSNQPYGNDTGRTVGEELAHLIAIVGENMNLRRMGRLEVSRGVVVPYMHGSLVPGLGRIGVIVALESEANTQELETLGRQIAMHVAASNPQSIHVSELDKALLDREKGIISEKARVSGKPEAVIEKMIEGGLRKLYEEVVLMEQSFIMDPDNKVKKIIEDFGKKNAPVELSGFIRFALGEGIHKETDDFAAEVASLQK
jgi:elongation factor Ts